MLAAVAQLGSVMWNTPATLARVEDRLRAAAATGAQLVVLPEALLGGYPKGLDFGVTVGARTEAGRDQYLRYHQSAIAVPGPETEALAALARELNLHLVTGAVERAGGSLYCAALVFSPKGLIHHHRKVMPTAAERVIWGQGDGASLRVVPTDIGRLAVAICWENYMPLLRQTLYQQNVEIWCAPTVDTREMWQVSMRHLAYEGRCFVLSAAQNLTAADWPAAEPGGLIEGHSLIVSPRGDLLAGPAQGDQLLLADLDLDEIPRLRFDLDVAGHYSRPDLFSL